MSTINLSSTYSQYKHDTAYIAKYLAETARSCGLVLETAPKDRVLPHTGEPTCLLDCTHEPSHSKTGSPTTSTKHIPQVQAYMDLARHIAAQAGPHIPVPKGIILKLDRVIKLRTQFSDQLRQAHGASASDEGHLHFIQVLKDVREVLQPHVLCGQKLNESKSTALTNSNMFCELSVEHPSHAFLAAPSLAAVPVEPLDTPSQDIEGESQIAYFALLKELDLLRANIRTEWTLYAQGERDLAVVSVASDAAVSLARTLEEEIPKSIRKQDEDPLFIARCYGSHLHRDETCPKTRHPEFDPRTEDPAVMAKDLIMSQVYGRLMALYTHIHGETSIIKKSEDDTDDDKECESATCLEALLADANAAPADTATRAIVHFAHLYSAYMQFTSREDFEFGDGMTLAMFHIREQSSLPVWAIFAVQLYEDSLSILHTVDSGDGSRRLAHQNQLVNFTFSLLEQLPGVSEQLRMAQEVKYLDAQLLKKLIDHCQVLRASALGLVDIERKEEKSSDTAAMDYDKKFRCYAFQTLNHWYCGICLHNLRVRAAAFGLGLINVNKTVSATAHLFKLLEIHSMKKRWEDLDRLLGILGPEFLWVDGRPPKTFHESAKQMKAKAGSSQSTRLRRMSVTLDASSLFPETHSQVRSRSSRSLSYSARKTFKSAIFATETPSTKDMAGESMYIMLGLQEPTEVTVSSPGPSAPSSPSSIPSPSLTPKRKSYQKYVAVDIVKGIVSSLEPEVADLSVPYLNIYDFCCMINSSVTFRHVPPPQRLRNRPYNDPELKGFYESVPAMQMVMDLACDQVGSKATDRRLIVGDIARMVEQRVAIYEQAVNGKTLLQSLMNQQQGNMEDSRFTALRMQRLVGEESEEAEGEQEEKKENGKEGAAQNTRKV